MELRDRVKGPWPDTENDFQFEVSGLSLSLKLPLVSVVIINWNYAKYLGRAIASVRGQTYGHFECIVVDNASTDASVAIINEAIAGDSRFRLRQMPENFGHLGAALAVLDEMKGEFVNFLDADDILFENFLASHIQVHLGTSSSVSFTSNNVVTIGDDDVLLSGGIDYIETLCADGQRCLPKTPQLLIPQLTLAEHKRLRDVTVDAPPSIGNWCWAPGSANVMRRELMLAIRPDYPNAPLFGGVDAYFLYPLFGLTGAKIIGATLSAYRVHDSNDFARIPHLRSVRNGNESAHQRNTAVKRLLMLETIRQCGMIAELVAIRYFDILDMIAKGYADSLYDARTRIFSDKNVIDALASQYFKLVGIFGERRVLGKLRELMKGREVAAVILAAYKNRVPFATLRRAAAVEWRAKRIGRAERRAAKRRASSPSAPAPKRRR